VDGSWESARAPGQAIARRAATERARPRPAIGVDPPERSNGPRRNRSGGLHWTEKVAHFLTETDMVDAQGNLYGTTAAGGVRDIGTVWELASGAEGHTPRATATLLQRITSE
jgi:hypothetical protein